MINKEIKKQENQSDIYKLEMDHEYNDYCKRAGDVELKKNYFKFPEPIKSIQLEIICISIFNLLFLIHAVA